MPLFTRKKAEAAEEHRPLAELPPLPGHRRPDHRAALPGGAPEVPAELCQRAAAVPPAPAGRAGPEPVRGDRRRPRPAPVRQLGDGRVRRPGRRRGRRLAGPAGQPAGGGGDRRRVGGAAPAVAGYGDEDHDRCAAAGAGRRHRAVREQRPGDRASGCSPPARWTSMSATAARTSRPGPSSSPGDVLGPRDIGVLAGIGQDTVVVRPARVVVISTGTELVEPGDALEQDEQIFDSNSYLLAAAVRGAEGAGVPGRPGGRRRRAAQAGGPRAAAARRPDPDQRRDQPGRLRRGQGGDAGDRRLRLRLRGDAAGSRRGSG